MRVPRSMWIVLLLAAGCGDSTSNADDGTSSATQTGDTTSGSSRTDTSTTDVLTSTSGETTTSGGDVEPAPTHEVEYTPSDEDILNPERGFYRSVALEDVPDLSWVRVEGDTLVYSYVLLDDALDGPIPQSVLDDTAAGLQMARAAGVKVVLRFAYNDDGGSDASADWVLMHLQQVTPWLEDNADVIAVLQAGFIGGWGEWHSSTNNLLDDREAILDGILEALPPERMTQLRTPMFKEERFGGPLTEAQAFDQSPEARVGHHNDCFLASDTDFGTYPADAIEQWKAYIETDTRFVPMGGETCAVNPPRSECDSAVQEMQRLHFSYIHRDYNAQVVASWTDGGCIDEIRRSLGYRLVLQTASLAETVRPGGWFPLSIQLSNVGWASLFNPRPVLLVLDGPGGRFEAEVVVEPRLWLAGQDHLIAGQLWLPSDAAPGDYTLSLWLPDASPELANDEAFAVRFANEGVWNAGLNELGSITLDEGAPGGSKTSQPFELVPQ